MTGSEKMLDDIFTHFRHMSTYGAHCTLTVR